MKTKRNLLIALVLMTISAVGYSQNIYVDSSAVVSGDGSLGSPYKTVQEAVDVAVKGNSIVMRAGTYRESVIVKTDSLTFIPYQKEKVTLSGADTLDNWTNVPGTTIYWAKMNWNVTAGNQTNQIFLNGKMLYEARWPKIITDDLTYMPDNAKASQVIGNIPYGDSKQYLDLYNTAFSEPAARWEGAQAWVNLARDGLDGQGWTGDVAGTDPVNHLVTIDGRLGLKIENLPWGLGVGTEFYVFSPTSTGVWSTGGVKALLATREWWKNGDTLYVKLPNASDTSMIEVKKRIYAFSPDGTKKTFSNTTIRNINFFATSLVTDLLFSGDATSHDNVIDSVNARYITHFINQRGQPQNQWDGSSGFLISGKNHIVMNSTFRYSAAAAISIAGTQIKIWNNTIFDVNYLATEAGAFNTGGFSKICVDLDFAYNTIYNTPQQGVDFRNARPSDKNKWGIARFHHNVIYNFMLRSNDSGAFDGGFSDLNWVRFDHNIIYNSTNELTLGIYSDYGGEYLIDHNLFYNVDRPVQMNQSSLQVYKPMMVYNNTAFSDKMSKPGIFNGVGTWGPYFDVRNNIMSGTIPASTGIEIIRSNVSVTSPSASSALFTNATARDYTPKSSATSIVDKGEFVPFIDPINNSIPDIGCFEYGVPAWEAGAGKMKKEFVLVDTIIALELVSSKSNVWKFPVTSIPYCGMTGDVTLTLSTLPVGIISAKLDTNKIAQFASTMLTIHADSTMPKTVTFTLTGTSGAISYVRTYAVIIPPVATSIVISPNKTNVEFGTIEQFSAKAYDQFGIIMDPQPVFNWTVEGAGTIDAVTGKYRALVLSPKVIVIATTGTLKDSMVFTVAPISLSDDLAKKITIYPNPAKDKITVDIQSEKNQIATIKMVDQVSSLVFTRIANLVSGENKELIDVSSLPNGVYFIQIEMDNRNVINKVVVVK